MSTVDKKQEVLQSAALKSFELLKERNYAKPCFTVLLTGDGVILFRQAVKAYHFAAGTHECEMSEKYCNFIHTSSRIFFIWTLLYSFMVDLYGHKLF